MTFVRFLRLGAAVVAWAGLGFIAFATLSPIAERPHVAGQGFEHIAAFGALGLLFGVAHPRRLPLVAVGIVCAAGLLEAAQLLLPDRHGRWIDFATKLAGAGLGLLLASVLDAALDRLAQAHGGSEARAAKGASSRHA